MSYKLPESMKGFYNYNPIFNKIIKIDTVDVLSKRIASNRQMRQKGKYDISIEDNYNYLSGGINNGIILHNSNEVTGGGKALPFYASVRIDIRKQTTNKEGEESVSNTVKAKIVKNKVAPPFREASFDLVFGKGIDKFKEVIDIATEYDIIKKSGSWFSYGESKIGQGVNSVIELLQDNPDLFEEIKAKTIAILNPKIDEKLIEQQVEIEQVNELVNELILEENETEGVSTTGAEDLF